MYTVVKLFCPLLHVSHTGIHFGNQLLNLVTKSAMFEDIDNMLAQIPPVVDDYDEK